MGNAPSMRERNQRWTEEQDNGFYPISYYTDYHLPLTPDDELDDWMTYRQAALLRRYGPESEPEPSEPEAEPEPSGISSAR